MTAEDMPLNLSRLTRSIVPVIALAKGSPLSPDESGRVEVTVRDHGFEGQAAPAFLSIGATAADPRPRGHAHPYSLSSRCEHRLICCVL
jgi:hypothetical protein